MRGVKVALIGTAALLAAGLAAPARADLLADGVTYTLTETAITSLDAQFVLGITGINGPSDTEGGRSGVQSFAFNSPANLLSATPPTGFTYRGGGLGANGCDGHGNFFCFEANTTPPNSPALAANSSLSFSFDLTLSSGSFSRYRPDFKIDWVGSKNNYNLISLPLAPTQGTPVPEPASLALLGTGLVGLGFVLRRRRRG